MKKERLYRGQRLDNGEWVFGFLAFIYTAGRNEMGFIYTDKARIFSPEDGRSYDVKTSTIGQCVGLKDINGKVCYEDDLLLTPEGDIMQIIWENSGFITKCVKPKHKGMVNTNTNCFIISNIVGNIHDNPDLF